MRCRGGGARGGVSVVPNLAHHTTSMHVTVACLRQNFSQDGRDLGGGGGGGGGGGSGWREGVIKPINIHGDPPLGCLGN